MNKKDKEENKEKEILFKTWNLWWEIQNKE